MTILHQSVLLKESIQALNIQKDGVYVDGTFGRGGHTKAILEALGPQGRVIAFDKDLDAVFHAQKTIQDQRFTMVHASFSELESIMKKYDLFGLVNGVLFDLGVSSPQLDESERGFSFMQEGPLDMRMDRTQAEDASAFIQRASVEEMTHVFRHFGEERFALRIARAIEAARQTGPIQTTSVLAEIVKKANPKWEKHKHPATRVFQAIRIHINGELEDLSKGLRAAVNVLAPNGRLAVISFHSLEDRVVKQFMKKEEEGEVLPIGVPVKAQDLPKYFRRVGKAVKPSEQEVQTNVRARSAVLRIGEKL